METAKIILQQIRAIDYWAMGAWGARNLIALPLHKHYSGGLKFKVNGTKTKKNSWIEIMHNEASDLYEIKLYHIYSYDVKVDAELDGVYCDQLVQVIDGMVG